MTGRDSNAPAWLFSFVDLAFLLLIAMTQIGSRSEAPDLGEIIVPRLHAEATGELPPAAGERWQLRVHPRAVPDEDPFELVLTSESAAASVPRLGADGLRQRLAEIQAAAAAKPILAPHRDSRSEDLLEAVGLLEEIWPGRRRATVAPMLAGT